MRILLTGGNSQLAHCLVDALPENWQVIRLDHKQLDITDCPAVQATVSELNVDFIVNTAAYTLVDKAEEELLAAEATNAIGPRNLAIAAEINSIPLIHISTDYVFSGIEGGAPLCEKASTRPLNVYGQTKLLGENAAMLACSRTVVIRTSWLFSEYGCSFVHTMLKLGITRKSLAVINDQFGCPTYAGDLAKCILTIIGQGVNESELYHFCGDRSVSWYEFAAEIFAIAKIFDEKYNSLTLSSISSEEYKCAAKRPKNAILDCEKIYRERGISSSDWLRSLGKVIPKIISQMNN
ncbi:dTDP-4-dehydrorhamnose reductase [Providencia burhodogranariea]|uniref:dTDP-4-dehydrorhamnose reductase n=1 Tax=Providencia burhodogranariea DSM 19968 TaxID=1141662 RepID=K8W690_9GAMM|nr:dTDP-4-dehydrorhamnose reductase [Providencia burhodogranariea]EKT56069.1 dTDP-4-dehydrorhamnose reductase [Providencia burhodogranariea DSM 19968]